MNIVSGSVFTLSIVYLVLCLVTIYYLEHQQNGPYILSKAGASATCLFIAAIRASGAETLFFWLILLVFVFCFFGDLFLALGHEIDNQLVDPQFTVGVGSFLIAQALLAFLFFRQLSFRPDLTLLFVLVPLAAVWYFSRHKNYDFGKYRYSTLGYGFFIGLMCAMAIDLLIRRPNGTQSVVMGIGGILFLCSDLILMFKFFRKKTVPHIGIAVLVTYFTAIWLIAIGAGC